MKKYICYVYEKPSDVDYRHNRWIDGKTDEPITGKIHFKFTNKKSNYIAVTLNGLKHNAYGLAEICPRRYDGAYMIEGVVVFASDGE